MDNKTSGTGQKSSGTSQSSFSSAARSAYDATSGFAQDAAQRAKEAASDTAAEMKGHVKQMLDGQVGAGADLVGHVAQSAKRAAEELEQNAPQIARLVHGVADRIEGYSDDLRDQDFDQLMQTASDFARRQPALVFGLAALAGFLVFRTVKATPSVRAPSIQPSGEEQGYPQSRAAQVSNGSSNPRSGGSDGL
jgi:ElaB/YqjD/DUF883 family membrane-anchored ribosome-binding protein